MVSLVTSASNFWTRASLAEICLVSTATSASNRTESMMKSGSSGWSFSSPLKTEAAVRAVPFVGSSAFVVLLMESYAE